MIVGCGIEDTYTSMDWIAKIFKNDRVKSLPNINFQKDEVCDACQLEKLIRTSFKDKKTYFYFESSSH